MKEYLNHLQEKFHYNEELIKFLEQLIPAMISYYGKEYQDTILQALDHCEIHFQEKNEVPKTYLNTYFGKNKDWEIPMLGGAFYQNEITVNEGKVSAKPIIYIIREFFRQYTPFDFQNTENVNTLVHEICHLVKGYGKLKVENGKIIDFTGLMKDVYTYTLEKGLQQEPSEQVGIEEAINEVDTMHILEIMTKKEQEIYGYKRAGTMATYLCSHEDIFKAIRSSQMHGDDRWIDYLGKENAQMLIENFDTLVKSMYVSFETISTPEKLEALHNKLNQAEDAIYDFSQNYSSKESLEEFHDALQKADQKLVFLVKQNIDLQVQETVSMGTQPTM